MALEKYCKTCKFQSEGKCEKGTAPIIGEDGFKCWLPSYGYSLELLKFLEPNERDEYLFSDVYEEEHLVRKIETGRFEEKDEEEGE